MENPCFFETSVVLNAKQSTRYKKQETLNTQRTAERTSCLMNRVHLVVQQSYSRLHNVRRW